MAGRGHVLVAMQGGGQLGVVPAAPGLRVGRIALEGPTSRVAGSPGRLAMAASSTRWLPKSCSCQARRIV
jgi:hypothetical protein